MTAAAVLALLTLVCPYEPSVQTVALADAISRTARTEHEAAMLVAISHNETTCGRSGVPFGACAYVCRSHCGNCRTVALDVIADHALTVYRRGVAECGSTRAGLIYYRTGRCGDPSARAYAVRISSEAARLALRLHL